MTAEEKLLDSGYEDVIYFVEPDYEPALIGVTSDYRAVYDFELMVEYLVETDDMTYEEAAEFIDYNCVGFGIEDGPIIMYPV
jgi:hypothetical protein